LFIIDEQGGVITTIAATVDRFAFVVEALDHTQPFVHYELDSSIIECFRIHYIVLPQNASTYQVTY
jgi:hypothetical protein